MRLKYILDSIIHKSLYEESSKNNFKRQIDCIKSKLEIELNKYGDENRDDRWVDIGQELRKIRGYIEDGYFSFNTVELEKYLNKFLVGLNHSDKYTYKKGEVSKTIGNSLEVYKAIGDKTLFRCVSVNDYNRIKSQGYIDSDMRGAILSDEGINLGQTASTALYYLPHNMEGVLLAINPKGLDLYMLRDEYIRVFEPIPIKNIIKVSKPFLTNKHGSILSLDTETKIDEMIKRLKKLDVDIKC
jgi:hypothetical protein